MIPNLFLPIVGTYGFSAVIVALAAWTGWAALWLARSRSWSRPKSGTWVGLGFLAIFLWSLIATFLFPSLVPAAPLPEGGHPIPLVQPHIGQAHKWVRVQAHPTFAQVPRLTATKDAPRRLSTC